MSTTTTNRTAASTALVQTRAGLVRQSDLDALKWLRSQPGGIALRRADDDQVVRRLAERGLVESVWHPSGLPACAVTTLGRSVALGVAL